MATARNLMLGGARRSVGHRWGNTNQENKLGRCGRDSCTATSSIRRRKKKGNRKGQWGRRGEAIGPMGHQQANRRRTTPASPSKPVPKRLIVPGSGTTEDGPLPAKPVLEQPRPSRTPT